MSKNTFIYKRLLILSFAFVFLVFGVGCKKNVESERLYFDFLGTTVYVNIKDTGAFFWDKENTRKCFEEIGELLKSVSDEFSKETDGSEVCKFNSLNYGESVKVSQNFQTVFGLAKEYFSKTDGAFNPTVSLSVDLWGFSKRHKEVDFEITAPYDRARNDDGSFNLPERSYVTAFQTLSNFSALNITGDSIEQNQCVTVNGETYCSQLDLSGIVKGYASGKIADIIYKYGYEHFYLSIGTSSMYLSVNSDDSPFDLGITDPSNPDGKPIKTIKVGNKYVSTSGVYQNCYSLDNKTYHHIIDANTGAPCETDILSATVISDCGAEADALSTAVVVMGSQKALEFFETYGDLGYVLICKDTIYERV